MRKPLTLISLALLALLAGACLPIPRDASTFTSPLPDSAAVSPLSPDATAAPVPDTVLTYHMEGGIAGFCDDLVIWADNRAAVTACGAAAASAGELTTDEAAQLAAWREELKSFSATTADAATADGLTTEWRFTGTGERPASDDEKTDIAGLAQQVLLRLRQAPAPTQTLITGLAHVESVEVQVLDESPLSVLVIARGNLPDGCTSIGDTSWEQEGDTFTVIITTVRPEDMMCTQALVPFEETVMIEPQSPVPPGIYTVDVNGVTATFELKQAP